MKIGYTHGRFQPLHNGHFNTFLKILEKYDELWIGIANPTRTYPPNMDKLSEELRESIKKAKDPSNNPYTFLERYEMIKLSLEKYEGGGVDIKRISGYFIFSN